MQRNALLSVGVVALLLVAGCAGQAPSSPGSDGAATQNGTIQVTGAGSAEATPNRAVVRLAVTATAPSAVDARQQLAANTSRMRTALEEIGIADSQITTTRYDLDRDLRRPRREGDDPRVQYRAYHGFEITLDETDRVGEVIDTAVQNGATGVRDIEFTLSTERRRNLEASARRAAMTDARVTAEQLASSANLTITGVKVVRTTSRSAPRPVEGTAMPTATQTPAGGGQTNVESGPVTVVATVHVVYRTTSESDETTG